MIKITKYKTGRHWALWHGDRLLAVVCYKKGAQALKRLLSEGPVDGHLPPPDAAGSSAEKRDHPVKD